MTWQLLWHALYLAGALGAVLVVAHAGGALARRLRQPSVIGEIATGLVLGPVVAAAFGPAVVRAVLPAHTVNGLQLIGQAGLALFLVGVGHEIRPRRAAGRTGAAGRGGAAGKGNDGAPDGGHDRAAGQGRAVGWVTAGAFFPALAAGALLAGWVIWTGRQDLRGDAPTSSFVLLVAVALAVTAVPVLSRILVEHGLATTPVGRLALTSAVIIDVPAWILLTAAIGLAAGGWASVATALNTLIVALVVAGAAGWLLRTGVAGHWCGRFPASTAVVVGLAAIAAATTTAHFHLTPIVGAVLVGLALPHATDPSAPWERTVRAVSRLGLWLVPVFFAVTGIKLLAAPHAVISWSAIAVGTALAILGKTVGTYVSARLARRSHGDGLRLGALMNTRGLTEIIFLQAGYAAGVLPAALFIALTVMALLTTALTGPVLRLIDRNEARAGRSPARKADDRRALTTQ